MAIDPKAFKAPYIDQQKCWQEADKFRQQYWRAHLRKLQPKGAWASCPHVGESGRDAHASLFQHLCIFRRCALDIFGNDTMTLVPVNVG